MRGKANRALEIRFEAQRLASHTGLVVHLLLGCRLRDVSTVACVKRHQKLTPLPWATDAFSPVELVAVLRGVVHALSTAPSLD